MNNKRKTQLIARLFWIWLFSIMACAILYVGWGFFCGVVSLFGLTLDPSLINFRQIAIIVACGVLGPILTLGGIAILYVFFRNKVLRFRWICKEGKVISNKTRPNKYQEPEYAAVVEVEIDSVPTQVTAERWTPYPWAIGQRFQVWFNPHAPTGKMLVEPVSAPWWFGIWMLLFGLLGFAGLWISISHEGYVSIHL